MRRFKLLCFVVPCNDLLKFFLHDITTREKFFITNVLMCKMNGFFLNYIISVVVLKDYSLVIIFYLHINKKS